MEMVLLLLLAFLRSEVGVGVVGVWVGGEGGWGGGRRLARGGAKKNTELTPGYAEEGRHKKRRGGGAAVEGFGIEFGVGAG